MFKRLGILVLAFSIILAILPVFSASGENFESWIIVDFRTSPDGTNWSSRREIQLVDGAFWYDASQNYIKIDRVRVLDTSNKPSDIFISFSVNIHPYVFTNVTSTGTYSGTQSVEWASTASYDGYFRSRQNQYLIESPGDSFGLGRGTFLVGQYHLPDTTGSTAFTLTPNSDVYYGFTYSSSTASGICLSITNVNCVFVGNDGMLYDIHQDLTNIKALMNQWYSAWNNFYLDFQDYLDFTENTLYPFLVSWFDEFDSWYSEWSSDFYPKFVNVWTYLTQTNYSYQGFAGNGAGLNSLTTKNPFQAINNHLSALVRYFNKIQKNDYSYDSISYDSDGIGTVTVVSNVPWFDAVLGQLQGQSAIDQHHMELENQAMDTGLGDLMGDAYTSNNISFGVGLLGGIFSFGDLGSFSSYHPDVDEGYGWFSSQNKNMIDTVTPNRDEVIVDFYSNNLTEILGKDDE